MKLLKKIAVTLVMTASMLAVSSTAFAAAEHKDLNAIVVNAAKNTEESLLKAQGLLKNGGSSDEIMQALNDARQHVKEFRFEATERTRQKLNDQLRQARDAFIKNDNALALEHVNNALVLYADMKKVYDAAH